MTYEHERKENVTSTNEPRENTYEGMIHEGTREVVIFWLKPFHMYVTTLKRISVSF